MPTDLSRAIQRIMEREMKEFGIHIVKKQCRDLGMDVDNIKTTDLPKLSKAISKVMVGFGGQEKAKLIYNEIRRLKDLNEVIDQQEDAGRRGQMISDMGDVHMNTGEWDKAMDYYGQMLATGKERRDAAMEAAALRKMANVLRQTGQYGKSIQNYEEALRISRGAGNRKGVAESLRGIGYIQWRRGQLSKAMASLKDCMDIARETKHDELLGHVYIDYGNVLSNKGDFEGGLEYYRRAIDVCRKNNDLAEVSRAYNNMGDIYLQNEDWDQAIIQFEKCRLAAEEVANKNMVAWATFNQAEAFIKKLDFARAMEGLEKSRVILEGMGDAEGTFAIHKIFGVYHTLKQEWDSAKREFEAAINGFNELDNPYESAVVHWEYGLMYRDMGDLSAAEKHLKYALSVFDSMGSTFETTRVREDLDRLSS